MDKLSIILLNISLLLFILSNIIEIIMANRFYREIEKEYKDELDRTIDEAVDKLLGDK